MKLKKILLEIYENKTSHHYLCLKSEIISKKEDDFFTIDGKKYQKTQAEALASGRLKSNLPAFMTNTNWHRPYKIDKEIKKASELAKKEKIKENQRRKRIESFALSLNDIEKEKMRELLKINYRLFENNVCTRCNYSWIPRKNITKNCPKCKSPYWNREKTRFFKRKLDKKNSNDINQTEVNLNEMKGIENGNTNTQTINKISESNQPI